MVNESERLDRALQFWKAASHRVCSLQHALVSDHGEADR